MTGGGLYPIPHFKSNSSMPQISLEHIQFETFPKLNDYIFAKIV